MGNSSHEMEEMRRRLQAAEEAISELNRKHFAVMVLMAIGSCETHYHMYLPLQKGEDLKKYGELWQKRLEDAIKEIEQSQTIEGVIQARDKFSKDIFDYVKAAKVDTADKAMEIAHSFIKKYSPVALPMKAERQDDEWLVDIDVGALSVKIAKVKVDARTGDILSYDIPQK